MKINRYYILITLLLALIPTLVSCRQETYVNDFLTLEVGLRWDRVWERDYGMSLQSDWDAEHHGLSYDDLKPAVPKSVNTVRYDTDVAAEEGAISPDGGSLTIGESAHPSFLLYNGDSDNIIISDMASALSVRASATPRYRASLSALMERHPDARTTNPPDILYSAFIESAPAPDSQEPTKMNVTMQPVVYTYLVRYEFEHGLEHVSLARGALAGMAESVYLKNGVTSDESSIILFDCEMKTYGCEARVTSFGTPGFTDEYFGRGMARQSHERPYTLNLEVMLTNGNIVEFNYDISEQLKNQPRGGVIIIRGIRIEDVEAESSSGIDVDISGWGDNQDIDLPMGVSGR